MRPSRTETSSTLSRWLARQHRGDVRVVGINGAQGCGKSTLAHALARELSEAHDLHAVVLALDDLYLPRTRRQALAREVHPLLATRGVPGTHDVALGLRLLDALAALGSGETLALPRFLKLTDDRAPRAQWEKASGPVDLVLFEGWCVGTPPQRRQELVHPINALEAREDADSRWRQWVNARLAEDYTPLFAHLHKLVFIAAPSFDCVVDWRLQQEATTAANEHGATMSRAQVQRFTAHYERLTRHALACLPQTADAVIRLDRQRRPQSLTLKRAAGGT